jgi:hypothetical protein
MKPTSKEKTMKNYYRKSKKFVHDHSDAFQLGAILVLATAATGITAYAAVLEVRQAEENQDWIREQNFAGKTVYELANGSLIAVSQDQVS